MPSVPIYTKCAQLGCKEVREGKGSFCLLHRGKPKEISQNRYEAMKEYQSPFWKTKEISQNRYEAMKEYQSPFWKITKRIQLSRSPLCGSCLIRGVVTQATVVDHLFPWTKIGKEAFKRNIWQSLCPECHSHKTALEQRDIVEHYDKELKVYRVADYALAMSQSNL